MRKTLILAASAVVLTLGATGAWAEPTTNHLLRDGQTPGAIPTYPPYSFAPEGYGAYGGYVGAPMNEGRAAIEDATPGYYGSAYPIFHRRHHER